MSDCQDSRITYVLAHSFVSASSQEGDRLVQTGALSNAQRGIVVHREVRTFNAPGGRDVVDF